jgi:hypothetical protein
MNIETLELNEQQVRKVKYFFDKDSFLVFFSLTDIGEICNKSANIYIQLFSLSDSPEILIKEDMQPDVFASTDKAIDFIEWNSNHCDCKLALIKEILIITQNLKEQ